jgi:hypothetical protein
MLTAAAIGLFALGSPVVSAQEAAEVEVQPAEESLHLA